MKPVYTITTVKTQLQWAFTRQTGCTRTPHHQDPTETINQTAPWLGPAVSSARLLHWSVDRLLNNVKHGAKPTNTLAAGTQTGCGNIYIFHLCSPLLLISQPKLKLTWITVTRHKRICIRLFVLQSGDGFVCMYTVSSYEVTCSSAN